MVRRAFSAEVTNGQLRFQESLSDLEGQRVLVVLDDECNEPLPTISCPRLTPDPMSAEQIVPEYDLNFERPFRRKRIVGTVYDGGRLQPTIILPEELPEEDGAILPEDDSTGMVDSDVMLDPWCELAGPTPIAQLTSRWVESLPLDIPLIPSEQECAP